MITRSLSQRRAAVGTHVVTALRPRYTLSHLGSTRPLDGRLHAKVIEPPCPLCIWSVLPGDQCIASHEGFLYISFPQLDDAWTSLQNMGSVNQRTCRETTL